MIDPRREEQAACYALGALSASEAAEFEAALGPESELERLVTDFQRVTAALAMSQRHSTPRLALKSRILARLPER